MPTYYLAYIPSEQSKSIVTGDSVSESLNINKLEDAEKILAAKFYTLNAKKCERNSNDPNRESFIREQYQDELQTMTKQFLEETPREFLRLNYFKVIEQ